MVITKIEFIDKNKAKIYIDYEYSFILYKNEIRKEKLSQDLEIDEKFYNYIINDYIIKRAKKKALNLLIQMDRTEFEIRLKLKRLGYLEDIINIVIDFIYSYNYIDDDKYAINYINYKKNNMSKKQIIYKLTAKGIKKDIIEKAISLIYDNLQEEDPEIIAIKKIIKKRYSNINYSSYEEKQKIILYLYRKGYSISKINDVFNDLL